jgi:hypothetical protein
LLVNADSADRGSRNSTASWPVGETAVTSALTQGADSQYGGRWALRLFTRPAGQWSLGARRAERREQDNLLRRDIGLPRPMASSVHVFNAPPADVIEQVGFVA